MGLNEMSVMCYTDGPGPAECFAAMEQDKGGLDYTVKIEKHDPIFAGSNRPGKGALRVTVHVEDKLYTLPVENDVVFLRWRMAQRLIAHLTRLAAEYDLQWTIVINHNSQGKVSADGADKSLLSWQQSMARVALSGTTKSHVAKREAQLLAAT